MGYNGVAPQDRATAQLQIVMGSLVVLGSGAGLLFVDLSETSRRGIPMWLLLPAVTLFGILIVGNGIRVWRRNGPPSAVDAQRPQPANATPTRSVRVARAIPAIYFTATGILGAIGLLAGIVTLVVGLIRNDPALISIGVLIGGGGAVIGLIGLSAAAYFRSVNSPDRK
jgi:hypothetical protein